MSVAGRILAAGGALLGSLVALFGLLYVAWFWFVAAATMEEGWWDGRSTCVGTFDQAAYSGALAVGAAGVDAALFVAVFVLVQVAVTGRCGSLRRLKYVPPLSAGAVAAGLVVVLLFQLDNPPAAPC